ncbi:MAG: DUF4398 domain-containing protein [Candidatus Binatia bacterium]
MAHKTVQHWIGVSLVCGALGMSGCSSARPPTETIAKAELALREASETNASQEAPLELRLAREKLDKAKAAIVEDDYKEARFLAEQALADAQLAETKAESENARETARELRKTIEALRTEAERTPAATDVFTPHP